MTCRNLVVKYGIEGRGDGVTFSLLFNPLANQVSIVYNAPPTALSSEEGMDLLRPP